MSENRPNVVFVFGDQWRAQATGYGRDPDVRTPNMDRLRAECADFVNAVSGCPVCSPYRGSLITGQYPLTHGVFLNDVPLRQEGPSIAECYREAGYETAYIGKWHLDGHGRSAYIPPERRQGFGFWRGFECSHSYNESYYYADECREKKQWDDYDAFSQTREAIRYLEERDAASPCLLFLSWGPPHSPYGTAPAEYRRMYDPAELTLPPNVPEDCEQRARETLAGYYAHVTALDAALGWLIDALDEQGMVEETILVVTSDHGDMVGSRGAWDKQRPYDESVRVPFLLRFPAALGREPRRLEAPIDAPDIMPTLLSLCGLPVPETVEGLDYADYLRGGPNPGDDAALLQCPSPFGNWPRQRGGREYRGVRTTRHTYVRDLEGPWLLFDNERDPYQLDNLVDRPEEAELQAEMERRLRGKLEAVGDEFLPAEAYLERWGYEVDERGCITAIDGAPVPGAAGYTQK
ncbi:MAG: sulfatase [Planctomycetota bacterium]